MQQKMYKRVFPVVLFVKEKICSVSFTFFSLPPPSVPSTERGDDVRGGEGLGGAVHPQGHAEALRGVAGQPDGADGDVQWQWDDESVALLLLAVQDHAAELGAGSDERQGRRPGKATKRR